MGLLHRDETFGRIAIRLSINDLMVDIAKENQIVVAIALATRHFARSAGAPFACPDDVSGVSQHDQFVRPWRAHDQLMPTLREGTSIP